MTENELLAELAQLISIPVIEPNEVTAQMLADKIGVTQRNARDQLNRMVQAGELTSRIARLPDGNRGKAYRKATSDD